MDIKNYQLVYACNCCSICLLCPCLSNTGKNNLYWFVSFWSRTMANLLPRLCNRNGSVIHTVILRKQEKRMKENGLPRSFAARNDTLIMVIARAESPWQSVKFCLYTLNRKLTMSPSFMIYSLPSLRTRPLALALAMEPHSFISSKAMTSARMKPRSKSV